MAATPKTKITAAQILASTKPKVVKIVSHDEVFAKILTQLKPCDFKKQLAAKKPNAEMKQKYEIVLSIQELLRQIKALGYELARRGDFIYVFNGAYWKLIEPDRLKAFLVQAVEKLSLESLEVAHYEYRDKLYRQFLASAYFESVETDLDVVSINLQNGTFKFSASGMERVDFDAKDFLTHQLRFSYDANAQALRFLKYLHEVLPETELQDILAEYFAYIFVRNLKLEKALFLYGSGANGKSVMFEILCALLGRENIANYSLGDLMLEHNRAQIANRLLNYGSEINSTIAKDIFKTLVSGEPIMARLKYGNSFLMESYAKLCFNCNELPKDIEQNESYFRRLLIIPFKVTIPAKQRDPELATKIIKSELSGVFNWVLAGLQRLLKNRKFTESKIVNSLIESYKRDSDSVACFLEEDNNAEGLLSHVYPKYRTYCTESGMKPLGKQNFRKRLEAHSFEVKRTMYGMEISKQGEV